MTDMCDCATAYTQFSKLFRGGSVKQNAQQMMMEKMMQQMMSGKVPSLAACASLFGCLSKPGAVQQAFSPHFLQQSCCLTLVIHAACNLRADASIVWHIMRLEPSLHMH